MQTTYIEKGIKNGKIITGEEKTVQLPFYNISARALIIRRSDGAILGTLHRKGGQYALPGGAAEDGENLADTVMRELEEENIRLIGKDTNWHENIIVDYFKGYRSFSLWYLIPVDEAEVAPCDENIETRWITQDEDVWYPLMRERILLEIQRSIPQLCRNCFKWT